MNYGLLEDEIVARLAPIVTAGHEVEAMPSIQSANSAIQHKGRITVQVGMAKGDQTDIQSQSTTSYQYEDVYVEIIIRAKRLRTNGGFAGVYELSELARKLLQGWRSTMSLMPFEFVDMAPLSPDNITDAIFTYSLRMKTRTMVSPDPEQDLSVLIEQITILPDSVTGPLAPSAEIYASGYSVDSAGDQVVLAWITSNSDDVEISGGGLGVVAASGSATVTISSDTTFTITATRGASVATAEVTVTVGSVCADATVELNGTEVATPASGATVDIPVTQNGSPVGSWNGSAWIIPPETKDVFIKFGFESGDDETGVLTIDADNAGTFTATSDDGSSGDITYNVNGGGFAAFSNPTVLAVSDTIAAKRTITTGAGYAKISGTYV